MGLKIEIPLKFKLFFYGLLTYTSFNRANKSHYIYKLNSDDKVK